MGEAWAGREEPRNSVRTQQVAGFFPWQRLLAAQLASRLHVFHRAHVLVGTHVRCCENYPKEYHGGTFSDSKEKTTICLIDFSIRSCLLNLFIGV